MREELHSILSDVKKKTSLDVTVYDFLGEVTAFTGEEPLSYKNIKLEDYSDGVYKDEKAEITHFLINIRAYAQPLHGEIAGVSEMSANYAYMVSAIVENAFRNYNPDVTRNEALYAILSGAVSMAETKLIKARYAIPDGTYYVFAIQAGEGNVGEVLNFLTSFSTSEHDLCLIMKDNVLSYIKYVDFHDETVSSNDFAIMLSDNIRTELSIDVKICSGGYAKGAEDFLECYEQALSGLKLSTTFDYPGKVFSFKEFLIINLLEELPQSVIDSYSKRLLDSATLAILKDPDMTGTAEVFMNHSLNISETARSLYIHRNTLMYRLDKIERDTGLNIRIFSDAVTFRILEIIYKMGSQIK